MCELLTQQAAPELETHIFDWQSNGLSLHFSSLQRSSEK